MCPSIFDLSDEDAVAFCPSCGAGYLAGVTRCSDCGLVLTPRAEAEKQVAQELSSIDETGGMKIVYSTQRPWVAQMLTHALQEHDIDAQIEGQEANENLAQPLAIWVPEEQSAEAKELISNIEASPLEPEPEVSRDADQTDGKSVGSTPSSSRFFAGLLLGAVLGYGYFAYQGRTVSKEEIPGNTDRNGDGIQDVWIKHSLTDNEPIVLSDSDYDGSPDEWFHYENGVLVRAEYDRNKDEKPDSWRYYNDMEQLARAEDDDDFNGEPDYWIEYENGAAHEFTTDNDFDGRGDEWGTFENGFVKKRSISFRNNGVADKRILYEHNRREEVRILNAFEEVTNITPKFTRITDVW